MWYLGAMPMPLLLEYSDYREYLRDAMEGLREVRPWFSLRWLGKQIALDPGNLVKVIQRERHLPGRCIAPLAAELGLTARDTEYLQRLVEFGKATTTEKTRVAYERLLDLKYAKPEVVGRNQYAFYRDWRCTAVLGLLHLDGIRGTEAELAALLEPRSTPAEVRRILDLLAELGMVEHLRGGRWRAGKSLLSTGEQWKDMGVRTFQKETLRLAERALDQIDPEDRDITTATVTLGRDDLAKVREMAKEFRRAVLALATGSSNPERVYQLNLQLFPLSRSAGGAA